MISYEVKQKGLYWKVSGCRFVKPHSFSPQISHAGILRRMNSVFDRLVEKQKKTDKKYHMVHPSFDSNVETNLGRKFLHIIDRCFPKNHPLHKIFNRHALQLKAPELLMHAKREIYHLLSNFNSPTQRPDT